MSDRREPDRRVRRVRIDRLVLRGIDEGEAGGLQALIAEQLKGPGRAGSAAPGPVSEGPVPRGPALARAVADRVAGTVHRAVNDR